MDREKMRKTMKKASFFFLFSTVVLSTSCMVAMVDNEYPEGGWYPRSEFQKTLALKPGGTLSLEDTNGDIKIGGWEEEKVEIKAEERGVYPRSTRFYFYSPHRFEPKIDLQSSDDLITIKTSSGGKEDELRVVNYDLRVPRSVQLRDIRNGQGNIQITDIFGSVQIDQDEGTVSLKNFSGSLNIALRSGSVEAELLDVRPEDDVRIKAERGDIVVYLEPGVDAQIEADAPGGEISSEIDLKQVLPAKAVSVRLGEGKATILLSALAGDIKIRKVEE
jgi:DUF4097 and DUF4098 domain-containing protein YvlB